MPASLGSVQKGGCCDLRSSCCHLRGGCCDLRSSCCDLRGGCCGLGCLYWSACRVAVKSLACCPTPASPGTLHRSAYRVLRGKPWSLLLRPRPFCWCPPLSLVCAALLLFMRQCLELQPPPSVVLVYPFPSSPRPPYRSSAPSPRPPNPPCLSRHSSFLVSYTPLSLCRFSRHTSSRLVLSFEKGSAVLVSCFRFQVMRLSPIYLQFFDSQAHQP